MAYVCKECGEKITGSVADHYLEKHTWMYVRNKKALEQHPSAFATPLANKEQISAIKSSLRAQKTKLVEQKKVSKLTNKTADPNFQKKLKQLAIILEVKPQEQTYRGSKAFTCDLCGDTVSRGRVIFDSPRPNWHVCYECYKIAKSKVPQKRGNKHVVILTPMRN